MQRILNASKPSLSSMASMPNSLSNSWLSPNAYQELSIHKIRAQKEAQNAQKISDDALRKSGQPPSEYEFQELIGKGASGRVYKSIMRGTLQVVAIKVLETDLIDSNVKHDSRDVAMQDALKEIEILRRLQDSNAVNVNKFLDAREVNSQLWIVSEYCSGGSVTTLRRATQNKLEEQHIRAIARELAVGLRSVHAAGIVHRDIKCSNVMVNEDGDVQIIDFGVAGIILSSLEQDKRKTLVGTPHWMAPEMQNFKSTPAHAYEVDVWAYGITLYEMACGQPPNATVPGGWLLQKSIRSGPPPRLEDPRFSQGLRDLVAFVLEPDPIKRPTMQQICEHPYLTESILLAPNSSLTTLVERYFKWEHSGGMRNSLFMAGGAALPQEASDFGPDEWNFSTTAKFDREHITAPTSRYATAQSSPNIVVNGHSSSFEDGMSSSPPDDYDEPQNHNQLTVRASEIPSARSRSPARNGLREKEDASVQRGERSLQGLFDRNAAPYTFGAQYSDLPLRSTADGSGLHRRDISVHSQDGAQIQLGDPSLKKNTKRETMAWTWGIGMVTPQITTTIAEEESKSDSESTPTVSRPVLRHANTMPDPEHMHRPVSTATLDLDALMGDSAFTMPAPAFAQNGPVKEYAFDDDMPVFDSTSEAFHATLHEPPSQHSQYTLRPSTSMETYQPLESPWSQTTETTITPASSTMKDNAFDLSLEPPNDHEGYDLPTPNPPFGGYPYATASAPGSRTSPALKPSPAPYVSHTAIGPGMQHSPLPPPLQQPTGLQPLSLRPASRGRQVSSPLSTNTPSPRVAEFSQPPFHQARSHSNLKDRSQSRFHNRSQSRFATSSVHSSTTDTGSNSNSGSVPNSASLAENIYHQQRAIHRSRSDLQVPYSQPHSRSLSRSESGKLPLPNALPVHMLGNEISREDLAQETISQLRSFVSNLKFARSNLDSWIEKLDNMSFVDATNGELGPESGMTPTMTPSSASLASFRERSLEKHQIHINGTNNSAAKIKRNRDFRSFSSVGARDRELSREPADD